MMGKEAVLIRTSMLIHMDTISVVMTSLVEGVEDAKDLNHYRLEGERLFNE
jgi:hypothetical protein